MKYEYVYLIFAVQFAKQTPTVLRDNRELVFFQNLAKLRKAAAFETLGSVHFPI